MSKYKENIICSACWHIWHVLKIFIRRHQLTTCIEFCNGKDWKNPISHALLDVFAVDNDMIWMTRSIDSGRIRINIWRQCSWHTWLHSCGGDGIRGSRHLLFFPASYFSFHEDNISFSQTYMPITSIIYEGLGKDECNILVGVVWKCLQEEIGYFHPWTNVTTIHLQKSAKNSKRTDVSNVENLNCSLKYWILATALVIFVLRDAVATNFGTSSKLEITS